MSAPTPNNELLRLAIGHANEKAPVLIGRLCDACVSGLTDNTKSTKAFTHGRLIGEALEQILRKRAVIVEAFPRHLQSFVTGAKTLERAGSGLTSLAKISFSKLELMDEGQVQESVEVARLQQNATSAVEAVMPELDALICGALGLRTVSHERNPMRVEIFVGALQAALVETQASAEVRLLWMGYMGARLGQELKPFYQQLSSMLLKQGATRAGYSIAPSVSSGRPSPAGRNAATGLDQAWANQTWQGSPNYGANGGPESRFAGVPSAFDDLLASAAGGNPVDFDQTGRFQTARYSPPVADSSSLTVAHLHRLLNGGFATMQGGVAGVAMPSSSAGGGGGYSSAIGIDLDALFAQPISMADGSVMGGAAFGAQMAAQNTQTNSPQDQELLDRLVDEALSLMIETMASDERLLQPVRRLIKRLLPSLASLVKKDQTFFTDPLHPARSLLDAVCQRGLAFNNDTDDGFIAFLRPTTPMLQEIEANPEVTAAVFEQALLRIEVIWHALDDARREQQELAVAALLRAERRTEYTRRVSDELTARPEMVGAPQVVVDFLHLHWSRVIANAEFDLIAPSDEAQNFRQFAADLLWSVRPELVGKNRARLTRLVPPMLGTLNRGLATIEFTHEDTQSFLRQLFSLHEQALRPPGSPPLVAPAPAVSVAPTVAAIDSVDTAWFAQAEAKNSGFMSDITPLAKVTPREVAAKTALDVDFELDSETDSAGAKAGAASLDLAELDDLPLGTAAAAVASDAAPKTAATPALDAPSPDLLRELTVGIWVDLLAQEVWVRAQLTWTSPLGKLYMFTDGSGKAYSMSSRSAERLMSAGKLRLVARRKVVERALDAVADRALANSAKREEHFFGAPTQI